MRQEFGSRLQAARRGQAARDGEALGSALGQVIEDLRPGAGSTVIDISADQVTVTTTHLDEAGSPQVQETGSTAWEAMLPMLATAGPDRYSQLADGIDGLGQDRVAALVTSHLPASHGDRALVVCRPAGWQIPEAAATALAADPGARLLRLSGADGISVPGKLADLATGAPLRHPYWLMTAAVDGPTGTVTIRPRQLFPHGARPGDEARLNLRKMPGDAGGICLAIFAGATDSWGTRDTSAVALGMYQVEPAAGAAALRAVLDGPGRVRIVEPAGAVPHSATWAQLQGQIPAQVTTTVAPADLVCAVDLAGPRDVVRQRKRLVRDLLQLLAAEYPDLRQLRIGLVTCTDHVFGQRRGQEYERVTRVCGLGPAAAGLSWLGGQPTAEARNGSCAPVEDLLDESFSLLAGSRRTGRAARLLTMTGRPPHPYPQPHDNRLPCPLRHMWEQAMGQLTRQAGARCAVVTDSLPGGTDRTVWRRIGPAGQRALPAATAREIAQDLGLLAGPGQHLPLPLADGT
jgi:hypothetical protein